MNAPPKPVTTLAPWYGSARLIARYVGEELDGCNWVGVPFAGGMTELLYLKARTIVASDLHRHVMNLACVVASDVGRGNLVRNLMNMPFHPDTLHYAQQKCLEMERGGFTFDRLDGELSECWALNFFIAAWMGRNGKAGTENEFKGGLSIRWDAGGGDSCGRFRSAVRSLVGWRSVLRRCTFQVLDVFAFLAKCQDKDGHGIYCDPPFPGPGDDYRHKFTEAQHCELACQLTAFKKTRVVCRFYDHPLIRQLYPEGKWTWRRLAGRDQVNQTKAEALIINGPSRAEKGRLF
jgi:site-specific DNA-adenine methylase